MIRRLDLKIVGALLVTTTLPLAISVYLVAQAIDSSLGLGLNREIGEQMERGLDTQRRQIEAIKQAHAVRFEQLIDSRELAAAAPLPDAGQLREAIERIVARDPALAVVRLGGPEGRVLEVKAVGDPSPSPVRTMSKRADVALGPYSWIEAVFAVDAEVVSAFEQTGAEVATYQALLRAPPAYLNRRFIFAYLSILGVAVALSIGIGVLWSRRLAARIHRLGTATSRVAAGDLSVRVEPGPPDEVGDLVESFNGMVAELELNRARIEYLQKISAWQEMARRLAHEIKNPLTPIHLAAQQLREKYDKDDPGFPRLLEQSTEIIEEEVATLRRLTTDFSSFARLPQVAPEPVDLGEFLAECDAGLAHLAERGGLTLVFDVPAVAITVRIDRMMMKRVIDNLTRNAAESLAQSGAPDPRIRVSARRAPGGRRGEVELRVEDNGPGITAEHHPSIFDPYFTTKSEGTGLGLAISKKIVLEHGGRIWLDEETAQGAAFVIALPVEGEPAP